MSLKSTNKSVLNAILVTGAAVGLLTYQKIQGLRGVTTPPQPTVAGSDHEEDTMKRYDAFGSATKAEFMANPKEIFERSKQTPIIVRDEWGKMVACIGQLTLEEEDDDTAHY